MNISPEFAIFYRRRLTFVALIRCRMFYGPFLYKLYPYVYKYCANQASNYYFLSLADTAASKMFWL
jgi:hypothetical protein